jgi:hypothetical protein
VSRKRILKFVRNVLLSIAVLAVVIVGAGVAYTWYTGQHTVEAVAAPVDETPPVSAPVIKPPNPAPNAKVGASVQMITSPVAPGANASITVKTNPTSECTIKVVYDTIISTDSGLSPKTADEYGIVSWTWTVEESVPVGKWPVKVTCAYNKNSAMVQGDLKIAK